MDKQQFLALIDKYLEGRASIEEEQMLLNYYGSFQHTRTWDEKVLGVKEEIENKMLGRIQDHFILNRVKELVRLWPRIAAAAAILLVVGAGLLLYKAHYAGKTRHPEFVSGSLDIVPGKNTAILTLANGKTISLSEAKTGVVIGASGLRYNDNTAVISKEERDLLNSTREMTSLATPRGGQYQITLPDGTKVWLNAASSLKFPSTFQGLGNRKVELSGEAYFEVAKDKAHPFIVSSTDQEVEVLGTHFNISSYPDEGIAKTTLLEGSVRVSVGGRHPELVSGSRTNQGVILKPNQQATLIGKDLDITQVDPQDAILWKNGKFSFNSEEMGSVMRKVARWYNVEVIFKDPLQSEKVSGSVSRFANMGTLLQKLEEAGGVHFKIEERTIIVTK